MLLLQFLVRHKENKLRLSWAKLSTIENWALLKLRLSLAIKVPHIVPIRSTHLAD